MQNSNLIGLYYNAKRTSVQLAQDRGFSVGDDEIFQQYNYLLKDFVDFNRKNAAGKEEIAYAALSSIYKKKIMVPFEEEGKIRYREETVILYIKFEPETTSNSYGVDFATSFIAEVNEIVGERKTGLVIINKPLSPKAHSTLLERKFTFDIQVFQVSELQFSPTESFLAPIYTVLNKEDGEKLLKENKLTKNKLLPILSSDPIVKYYGWKRGQLIEKLVIINTTEQQVNKVIEYSYVD